MKFLILFAVCIGAAVAEVSQEAQLMHELEMAELCKERGVFPNPHDAEHKTFIRCELEPVELRCDEGFIFDAEKLMCVEEPKPVVEVDLNTVNWQSVLKCPEVEDKYFRNPYDCSRFFRCYKQGEFKRLDVGTCLPTMIFDEVLETCLPIDTFKSYYGQSCENKALPADDSAIEPEEKPIENNDNHHHHEEEEEKPIENNDNHELPEENHKPEENQEPGFEPEENDKPEENQHHEEEHKHEETHEQEHHEEEKQEENPFEPQPEPNHEHDHHDETGFEPEEKHEETHEQEHHEETHEQEHHEENPFEPEPEHHDETPVDPEPVHHEETPVETEVKPKKQPSLEDILRQIKNAFGNM